MADQDKSGIPIGDVSNIIDDKPEPCIERSIMPVPVSERVVTPDKEVLREPSPGDAPALVMPGELNRLLSSNERQADVARVARPCPECMFFSFPDPTSADYREMRAMLSSFVSNLPAWMRDQVPGRNVEEWGSCQGAPHGKRIMVHMLNSCAFFKARGNSVNRRGIIARLFGRGN